VRTQCGPCHAVTYLVEGHLEDYAPYGKRGGSIASSVLRKCTQKRKNSDAKCWGKADLYYTSENKVHGSASLKTSHFAGPEGNCEASPVRKRVRPPYLMYIYYKLLNPTKKQ
jgi:hypothetical protein